MENNAANNVRRQRSRTPRPRGFLPGREWSVLNYNVLNTMGPPSDSPANPYVRGAVLAHIAEKEAEAKKKAGIKAEKQALAKERTRQSKERYRARKAAERAAAEKAANGEASEPLEEEERGRSATRAAQRIKGIGSSKSRSLERGASSKRETDLSKAFRAELKNVDDVAAFYGDLSEVSDEELAIFDMEIE